MRRDADDIQGLGRERPPHTAAEGILFSKPDRNYIYLVAGAVAVGAVMAVPVGVVVGAVAGAMAGCSAGVAASRFSQPVNAASDSTPRTAIRTDIFFIIIFTSPLPMTE
jgi:hypothetical protein